MPTQFDLLSLGSIYLDINCLQTPFTEGLLTETETICPEYQLALGGSAVISALVAANLGLKPLFVGTVGNDQPGQTIRTLFQTNRIHPALITSSAATNLGLNFVNPAGKTIMVAAGGANQTLTGEAVITQLTEWLPQVTYLYLGSYFKLTQLKAFYPQILELAHHHKTQVVLDHGRVNSQLTSTELTTLRELIPQVDIYLPSEDEFLAVWQVPDVAQGLQKLHQLAPQTTVVVKMAEQGAMTWVDGQAVHIPALAITPQNTVGAGDSFNAGFIAARHRNLDLVTSVRYAAVCAGLKISQPELPTHSQIENYLSSVKMNS